MQTLRNLTRLALPIGLIVAMLMATASVTAQTGATPTADDSITFGVRPADGNDLDPFRFEIDAGAQAQATLIVTNGGEAAVELQSGAADIETRVNGGYQVVADDTAAPGNAAWLSIDTDPYLLEPGKEIDLALEITVPEGTPPGEYMAAVTTQTTESAPIEGTSTFRQISRKINAVVITVPGPVQAAFELGDPSLLTEDGGTTLIVPVHNTGNVRVKPAGTITISDANGDTVAKLDIAMDSVYAWDSTVIQQPLSASLPPGDYTLSVDLTDQSTGTHATLSNVPITSESAERPA